MQPDTISEETTFLGTRNRGCGKARQKGGTYATLPVGQKGLPWWAFLIDPTIPVPPEVTIPTQGVSTFEVDGITHVVDWIGAVHYPDVLAFTTELRAKGLSRRCEGLERWAEDLSPDSMYFLVHPKGHIRRPESLADVLVDGDGLFKAPHCPTDNETHPLVLSDDTGKHCVGLLAYALGEPVETAQRERFHGYVGDLTYSGWRPPASWQDIPEDDRFAPAFFMGVPVTWLNLQTVDGAPTPLGRPVSEYAQILSDQLGHLVSVEVVDE